MDNPYAGVKGYVNPEWKAKADGEPGGSRVSNNPTAVWLDRIAAINGTANSSSTGSMGVRDHLDKALAQGPATSSSSSTTCPAATVPRWPPTVSWARTTCRALGAIGNVYNYIDAAHHGWIGWGSNFGPTANQLLAAATASGSTVHNVQGFVTTTANYSALQEPYVKITDTVNGQTVRQGRWIDWNQYVDELSFAQAFRNKLVSVGFDSTIGMLVDTSRNGAGAAPARPTGPGATTSVDTYVNGGRIDRRIHAGNARNGNNPTGALPNAPISGAWFSAQFQELMRNVYPPIS